MRSKTEIAAIFASVPKQIRRRPSAAFTLVELLVVIAIIGVLIALLLPAVQAAREAARRSQCSNNLKQIALAALNYESSNGHLPAGSLTEDANAFGPYLGTWSVYILPYLEQQSLYDLWDNSLPLESNISSRPVPPAHRQIHETPLDAYVCPSDQIDDLLYSPESGPGKELNYEYAPGSYRAMSGFTLGRYWDHPNVQIVNEANEATAPSEWRGLMHTVSQGRSRGFKEVELQEVEDGLSNTFLVGEYHTTTRFSRRTLWAYAYTSYNQSSSTLESRALIPDYERCISLGSNNEPCKRAWGSLHAGGIIQFANGDGSVVNITDDVDLDVFARKGTVSDQGAPLVPGNTGNTGGTGL